MPHLMIEADFVFYLPSPNLVETVPKGGRDGPYHMGSTPHLDQTPDPGAQRQVGHMDFKGGVCCTHIGVRRSGRHLDPGSR
jgi:hypothetical protein